MNCDQSYFKVFTSSQFLANVSSLSTWISLNEFLMKRTVPWTSKSYFEVCPEFCIILILVVDDADCYKYERHSNEWCCPWRRFVLYDIEKSWTRVRWRSGDAVLHRHHAGCCHVHHRRGRDRPREYFISGCKCCWWDMIVVTFQQSTSLWNDGL